MKPFNFEDAKAGQPVCTRDGRDVRIICFDIKSDRNIIGIVKDYDGEHERIRAYDNDGCYWDARIEFDLDLFMKPTKEKRWAIYDPIDNLVVPEAHHTYKDAEKNMKLLRINFPDDGHQVIEFEVEV